MPDLTPGELKLKTQLYHYAAVVTDVYDGDTITVDIDFGVGIWRREQRIRLWKLNTPEVRGEEAERGKQVRDFVSGLLLGKTILLRTILDKRGQDETEKFGRLLGEIMVEDETGVIVNVNDLLLMRGMAIPMREDGTIAGLAGATPAAPDHIACPLCGETRAVDQATLVVAACPNCFDEAYRL
ncbi:MAG: thermonuclease family protein [Caldilineales bacterium]|nr:thermonuclease family protein [Caldilineales bacterium]